MGTALEEASGCSSEIMEQKPARKQGAPNRCWNKPDIRILFDDHRLVANGPATLRHLGLREVVDLTSAERRDGDWGQDADAGRFRAGRRRLHDALRAGGTVGSRLRGQGANPGDLPAQLPVGACPSNRVSRQLLARAWAAGAGPGDSPLTIDLDSSETYGLAKEGARYHGYTHPLLAIAAGTGEVLMSQLREGRANNFLRETVGRVRYGGARGQLTVSGLRPHCRCRLPGNGCASLSPSASAPACGT